MLHVLCISTLFPDATRPNFGIFVEKPLLAVAQGHAIQLTVVAPVGLPPWPLSLHPRYAALRALPVRETWHGLTVLRPRFRLIPGRAARNASAIARVALPIAQALHANGTLDVIDAQFFHPDGAAARLVAQALGLPYSVQARGSDIAIWARRPDTAAQISTTARDAAGLLAVSAAMKADMVSLGMAADTIAVRYTGLDATRFKPLDRHAARAAWGLGSGPVILTVGTMTERKGQGQVIAALPALPDVTYVMAGTGDAMQRFAALAERLGVADRVRMLGAVPHDDLPMLYNAADVMVLASVAEGLANVWVEALACGTPLVLADIPPAHEVIDGADAGCIVAHDPAAIAAAVRTVLAMPVDRATLAARTHARFNWARNGVQLAAHWRKIAGR